MFGNSFITGCVFLSKLISVRNKAGVRGVAVSTALLTLRRSTVTVDRYPLKTSKPRWQTTRHKDQAVTAEDFQKMWNAAGWLFMLECEVYTRLNCVMKHGRVAKTDRRAVYR